MADFKSLTTNIRVMAPLGDQMHRGIIVAPPDGHARRNGMICVEFMPPVKAAEPYSPVTHITCEVESVELGWSDE